MCDIWKVQFSGDLLPWFVVNFLLVRELSTSRHTKATEILMVGITLHNGLLNPMIVLTELSSGSIIINIVIIVWPLWSHLKQFSGVFRSLLHHQFAKVSLQPKSFIHSDKNCYKKNLCFSIPKYPPLFPLLPYIRFWFYIGVRSFWLSVVNLFPSRVFNRQVFCFIDVHS